MRIGRTLPPAAAPVGVMDLGHGVVGALRPDDALRAREQELRDYFGVRAVFLLNSGTAALTLTLQALSTLSSRREVVIPAYTCFSVPAAVVKAGLRPVLCDVDPSRFDYDHTQLAGALSDETLCVVVQHLFGIASEIAPLRELCQARGIFLVEDAAQAMGISSREGLLGTLGDAGVFSLGRGKNITCGSGGIVVTGSTRVAEALRQQYMSVPPCSAAHVVKEFVQLALMTLFIRPALYWIPASVPFLGLGRTIFPKEVPLYRLSAMQAGLLEGWQTRLGHANQTRSRTSTELGRRLALPLVNGPSHPYLRLPMLASSSTERARIHSLAERRGLGVSLAYPTPVNEIPEISPMFKGQRFPAARAVADRLLTLPTHQWLRERDTEAIAECIAIQQAS